ncbi:MAG: hypothetical protein LDL44_03640 [Caenispirillum sp.]|nr:hypothetical protein [Caenispirillum sp.]
MSSVVKGVGKVFKKVAKVAKVIAPVALAAAAVYFTAGAALGVAGTAGGWGAAVSSVTGALEGTLGQIVTGAVTQAGYGAAIGAATSAITGGDPLKGALTGAIGGAVTGGVSGAIGLPTDPLSGIGQPSGANAQTTLIGSGGGDPLWGPAAAPATITGQTAPATATAPAASPGLLGKGGWVERNGTLVGNTLSGLGSGLLKGMSEDEAAAERYRGNRYASNYRLTVAGDSGLLPRAAAAELRSAHPQNPMVIDKYTPSGGGHVEYRFNPQTNQIDRVWVT